MHVNCVHMIATSLLSSTDLLHLYGCSSFEKCDHVEFSNENDVNFFFKSPS